MAECQVQFQACGDKCPPLLGGPGAVLLARFSRSQKRIAHPLSRILPDRLVLRKKISQLVRYNLQTPSSGKRSQRAHRSLADMLELLQTKEDIDAQQVMSLLSWIPDYRFVCFGLDFLLFLAAAGFF